MQPHSIYIHIPFCKHRCNYCDFNTYAGLDDLIPAYTAALLTEIQIVADGLDARLPVHTVYFGGGTPSLLPSHALMQIMQVLKASFDITSEAEISLEANPGILSYAYLHELHQIGFNRLSLGVQSAHPGELKTLERQHDFMDVVEAVKWARQVGFDNLSLDLIFGLPEQAPEIWLGSLDLTLSLAPEHFSLYALTIEQGTPLGDWFNRGLIPEPDPDVAANMYELASEKLSQAGYLQYEISNWARSSTDLASKHNLQYWRNLPYLGFGAGAHGYIHKMRTANILFPPKYIQRLSEKTHPAGVFPQTPATADIDRIDREREMDETMMMGLRLTGEGVSKAQFEARFSDSLEDVFAQEIRQLVADGLLEWHVERLRLTTKGRLLGNQVFRRFV